MTHTPISSLRRLRPQQTPAAQHAAAPQTRIRFGATREVLA